MGRQISSGQGSPPVRAIRTFEQSRNRWSKSAGDIRAQVR